MKEVYYIFSYLFRNVFESFTLYNYIASKKCTTETPL